MAIEYLEDRNLLASFQGLGFFAGGVYEGSNVTAVSADGTTAVGTSPSALSALDSFRWTSNTGLQSILGLSSGGGSDFEPNAVSADGSVVVGTSYIDNESSGAFLQPQADTPLTQLPLLPGFGPAPDSSYSASATGVSADGTIVAGTDIEFGPQVYVQAFKWSSTSGIVALGQRIYGVPGHANAVSADGSVVVGDYGDVPVYWKNSSTPVSLGNIPGQSPDGTAYGVSSDGSVVVGQSASRAFKWTAAGMVPLTLPGGQADVAWGVSSNGNVIVGEGELSGSLEAIVWNGTTNGQSIKSLLLADGLDQQLAGWRLLAATGVSADGTTIVGDGVDPQGKTECWIAHLGTTITPSVKVAGAGEAVAYSISVSPPNQGQEIEVQDTVPAGTTLVPASVSNGGVVSTDTNGQTLITWKLPDDKHAVLSFTVTVNDGATTPLPANIVDTTTMTATVGGQEQHDTASAKVTAIQNNFNWKMPPRYGVDINGNPTTINKTVLQNLESYVNPDKYTLQLDASTIVAPLDIKKWTWSIVDPKQPTAPPVTADGEKTSVQLPQGRYDVTLTLILADGTEVPIKQQVTVRDILIVDMGESFSSGEGNPDQHISVPYAYSPPEALPPYGPNGPLWALGGDGPMTEENAQAHRSTLAGSSQAAFNIEEADPHFSVTYVMVSISGAKMNDGMFSPEKGLEDTSKSVSSAGDEIDELNKILNHRRPDIIYLSMGGDDAPGTINGTPAGFGALIKAFLLESAKFWEDPADVANWENTVIQPAVTGGLKQLASNYTKLAAVLQKDFSPHYVIQTDYPNPTEGDFGTPIAFGSDIVPLLGITQQMSEWLTGHVFAPLNAEIEQAAHDHGWQFKDVAGPFTGHGYGSSVPYFQTATDSRKIEGYPSIVGPESDGTAHPNASGQKVYAQVLQPTMQKDIDSLLALPNLGLPDGAGGSDSALPTNLPSAPDVGFGNPLVVTTQPPSDITAGASFGLEVTAENADGSVDTSFNGDVTVASFNSTLIGTTTVTAINGVATFSGLTIDTAGGGYLLLSADGFTSAGTDYFKVNAALASQVVVPVPSGHVIIGGAFAATGIAEDPYGNVDTNFSSDVTLALAGGTGNAVLGGSIGGTASGGFAAFSGLTIDQLGSGYTLLPTAAGLTGDASSQFDVTDKLVVTTPPPSSITAGEAFGLTLTAEDGQGNLDTTFNGSITLELTDSNGHAASLGGVITLTAVNGVATFSGLTADAAGNGYTLCAVCASAPGVVRNALNVNAASATQLVVSGGTTNLFTNNPFGLQIYAEDQYGNVDPGFNGAVTLEVFNSAASNVNVGGTLTVNAVNGVASFSGLTIASPGNDYDIYATSPTLLPASGTRVNVLDGRLVITSQPPSTITAGTPFGLMVEALDAAGNIETSFNGAVTLTDENGSSVSQSTATAINGVATFSDVKINNALAFNALIANGNNLAPGISKPFAVTPGNASVFVNTSFSTAVTVGATFDFSFAVLDSLLNVMTSFNGTATVQLVDNANNAALGGTLTAAVTNGVANFPDLTIDKPGTGYHLEAAVGSLVATTGAIDVAPAGGATQLVITTQPPSSVAAGSAFGLTVGAEDGSGNLDPKFNGVVTIKVPGAPQPLATVTAVNGVATFSGLSLDEAGVTNLVITSGNLDSATSFGITVSALPAVQLAVSNPLGNVLPGVPFSVLVSAEDKYGNIAPTFDGNITLGLGANPGSATLGGDLTVTAIGGNAVFPGLTIDKVGTGYTLQADSGGLALGTSPLFNVTADQLVVTTQPPGDLQSGSEFGFTVAAENSAGNIDPSFSGNVTVSLVDFDGSGATLGGTLTVAATNGVATFSGLTLNRLGNFELVASGDGLGSATTDPVNSDAGLSSATSTVTPLPATEPPTFTVNWSGSDPGGPAIATYSVYVSDNGGPFGPFQIDTTATSATFNGLAGHDYGFYSIATDTEGNIQPAPTAAQTTTLIAQPVTSTVTALPAFSTPSFTVSWSGSDPGGPGVASYSVFVSDNDGSFAPFLSDTTATSVTFTGQPGHKYAFYSVATDNAGNVQPTPAAAQATTFVPEPPSSTVAALPAFSTPSFTISWSGSDPGGPGIASYDVFVSEDSGSFTMFVGDTAATSATFNGQPGHNYAFYSLATDAIGNVQPTPAAGQATTLIPLPPTSTVAALPAFSATSFLISWSGSDPGGPGIASYDVFVSDNGGSFAPLVSDTAATSAAFTGQPGHTYAFYSIATDSAGNVQDTPGAAQATTTVDGAPPISSVDPLAQRATSLTFPVSVTGSDPSPGSGVSSYDIYVAAALGSSPLGAFTLWTTVPANNPTALFTAQSNATYAFHSIAHDAVGNVETKAANLIEASTYVPDLTPPVTQITGDPADAAGTFTLTFSGTSPGGSGVKSFVLSVRVDYGPIQQFGTFPGGAPVAGLYSGQTTYQGLTDGNSHKYTFFIQGINGNGVAEAVHAATPVTYIFAVPVVPAVTSFVVEKGLSERSYIRYLDVTFNEPTSALDLGPGTVTLEEFGLDGTTFSKDIDLTGKISLIDKVMEIDFGAGGIGGSENLPALLGNWSRLIGDDGYYKLLINPDGTGLHNIEDDFYRLFGDVLGNPTNGAATTGDVVNGNAIGVVSSADVAAVTAAVGEVATAQEPLLNADINGAGAVTAMDRLLAARSVGRRLAAGLHLDD